MRELKMRGRVQGSGFRIQGSGFKGKDLDFWDLGLGFGI
jgi:hypothetical protein